MDSVVLAPMRWPLDGSDPLANITSAPYDLAALRHALSQVDGAALFDGVRANLLRAGRRTQAH